MKHIVIHEKKNQKRLLIREAAYVTIIRKPHKPAPLWKRLLAYIRKI